ncbi:MAG: hypothetical protein AB7L66_13965 [Gemmatimonadales bacterium]
MPADFDLGALRAALDDRRAALGLRWAAIATELGVSASTLSGFGSRTVAEGDGVLRAVAWLGRIPESFVPGFDGDGRWRDLPGSPRWLRFDVPALYAALDAARLARGLTWRDVAKVSGAPSASVLSRLEAGGRVMFPQVTRTLAWLGAPATRFVRVTGPA